MYFCFYCHSGFLVEILMKCGQLSVVSLRENDRSLMMACQALFFLPFIHRTLEIRTVLLIVFLCCISLFYTTYKRLWLKFDEVGSFEWGQSA